MSKYLFYIVLLISLAAITTLVSRSFRVSQVPNGNKFDCNTCHINGGGSERNSFGKQVEMFHLTAPGASGNVKWTPLLASLDADNDGISNGEELQDPFGVATESNARPGDQNLVSSPGDKSSTSYKKLTINFSDFSIHLNQTLYLVLIDRTTMKEAHRTSEIINDSFTLETNSLLVGHSYYLNFFADHNSNGLYDLSPTDHSWQIMINSVDGDKTVDFAHHPNFDDFEWNYNLNLQFSGMTPHVGQLLEARVIQEASGMEVGRERIEFVPSAEFEMNLPFLKNNESYIVQVYADFNKNGHYDSPPTDHSWEFPISTTDGDVTYEFTHNTEFKELNWTNLFTLNLIDFFPHGGQMLYARLTKDQEEVSRVSLLVPEENFSIMLPGLENGSDYNIDFFADFNENGDYDAPPTDHAWRLIVSAEGMDIVENFTHNIEFTDIKWNDVTDIKFGDNNIANEFKLEQNYPNPFNPTTKINYSIPNNLSSQNVRLDVFNILGKEVTTLVDAPQSTGNYSVDFDASNLSSGTYIYRLSVGQNTISKKMVLMK